MALAAALGSGCVALRTRSDGRRMSELISLAADQGLALPDPLALSPAATEKVLIQVGREGTELDRVKRLHRWLRDQAGLGFRYDALHTRGAQDAWEARTGDCLTYAHLFNALARFLQVPANYVRYREAQTYEERDGQFLVVSHVASLYNDYRVTILVELTGQAPSYRISDYELIGDDEAAALHYSNLAMEQLAKGDNATPEKLLRLLVERTPGLPEIHNNLGAVLLRAGKPQEALAVLKRAIAKFPDFVPLYVNGALAARWAGETALAEELAEKARSSWTDPFLPFVRGTWLLDRGKPVEAVKLLRRAVSLKPASAMFRAWLAKALLEAGRWRTRSASSTRREGSTRRIRCSKSSRRGSGFPDVREGAARHEVTGRIGSGGGHVEGKFAAGDYRAVIENVSETANDLTFQLSVTSP